MEMRKNNRRIVILWYIDEDGSHTFIIETKRLIDFKKRHILRWNGLLSLDTFIALTEGMMTIMDDPEFRKLTNPQIAQLAKERWRATTNVGT